MQDAVRDRAAVEHIRNHDLCPCGGEGLGEGRPDAPGAAGDETSEYNVEKALSADDESDEDVLEETPEFLQDTPDHDRLWFEQRPPKDFDFDG